MIIRQLSIRKNHSFFLLGSRGTGKSTLLRAVLPAAATAVFDLLDFDLETRLLQQPGLFAELLAALPATVRWVVIDEVQKIPALLDEVHRHIERSPRRHFALTGSSARKLKRGQANLLAGRAFTYGLHPLTSTELGEHFSLHDALAMGTLPKICTLKAAVDRCEYLRAYAQTYLKEEIQSEGIIRNLTAFRRFLPLAATANGQILSWSNFASDVGIDAKTIRSYFEILEDTLLGVLLPAYARSLRKQQRTHPKFYFFDPGVKRALAGELTLPLTPGTDAYGRAFEHFWIVECVRQNEYLRKDFTFSYFATPDTEIDLVIERPGRSRLFVEFKSASRVKEAALRPLRNLMAEVKGSEAICVCCEPRKRRVGAVLVCPWQEFLSVIGLEK